MTHLWDQALTFNSEIMSSFSQMTQPIGKDWQVLLSPSGAHVSHWNAVYPRVGSPENLSAADRRTIQNIFKEQGVPERVFVPLANYDLNDGSNGFFSKSPPFGSKMPLEPDFTVRVTDTDDEDYLYLIRSASGMDTPTFKLFCQRSDKLGRCYRRRIFVLLNQKQPVATVTAVDDNAAQSFLFNGCTAPNNRHKGYMTRLADYAVNHRENRTYFATSQFPHVKRMLQRSKFTLLGALDFEKP